MELIQSTFTIGIIMTVIMVILAVVLGRASLKGYTLYYPFAAVFMIGLICLLFATILDRIPIAGAGLGGWGLACIFSSAIGFIIAAIIDTYVHAEEEAS